MAEANNTTTTTTGANTEPAGGANTNATTDEGKVFSADYVKALREESKGHRLTAKSYEAALKKMLGVDSLDDLDSQLSAYTAATEKRISDATAQANQRLIQAELKSKMSGYDEKLLTKLIDLKDVKIDDSGKITGIDEAIKAVEEEFPQVKIGAATHKTAAGTGSSSAGNDVSGVEALFLAKNPGLKI